MKCKKIVSFIAFIIMLVFAFSNFSLGKQNELVIKANKDEVKLNEEFYIIIDTSNVEIDEFEISVQNNFKLDASSVEDDGNIDLDLEEKNSDIVKFKVNKNDSNSNKFAVYYIAPPSETNLEFIVSLNGKREIINEVIIENTVTEEIKTEDISLTEKIIVTVKKKIDEDIDNEDNMNVVKNNVDNVIGGGKFPNDNTIENKVLDKDNISEKDKEFSEEEMEGLFGTSTKKQMEKEMLNMREKMTAMQEENSSLMLKLQSNQVVYQGSFNNYLKNLEIKGASFKNSFHKTISTYFAEVDENIESLDVIATPEDSSAIVTIYGNSGLKEGQNKILINVTADDESIRTYRIYVNKN